MLPNNHRMTLQAHAPQHPSSESVYEIKNHFRQNNSVYTAERISKGLIFEKISKEWKKN